MSCGLIKPAAWTSFLKNFQLRSLKFSNLRHRQVIRSRPALNASMLTANIRAFILLILRGFGDANLISQRDHLIALAAEKRITRSDKGAYAPILNGCKSLLKIISGRDSQHHELAPQPVRSCRDVLNVELNVRIGRVDQEADGLGRRCHLVKQLKLLGYDFPGLPPVGTIAPCPLLSAGASPEAPNNVRRTVRSTLRSNSASASPGS